MSLHHSARGRLGLALGPFGASALLLAGCAGGGGGTSSSGGGDASGQPLIVGTTDKITSIDPAGSYDNGSFAVMNQIYPFLFNSQYGTADVTPAIAESGEFTSPTEYTVKLKDGLKFANGHDLTASDVKFTFDRQVKIADPNGPSSLLGNLESVAAPDDTTVVFTLKNPNDQTWEQILSSPAGPIVDEEVFSADAVTPDDEIVKGKAFAGQYVIDSYKVNELISYKPYSDYKGELPAAENSGISVKYYADPSNLKLDIANGDIDVAYRSLSATDIDDLSKNDKVKIVDGPGGEIRYIVFNFNTMPYGATTAEADPAKALAIRQAAADLVDRDELSKDVYKGTYTPLYSFVPQGLTGAIEPLKELYGDGNGKPDAAKAKQTEWVQYAKDRTADVYPAYQLGWFPDYSDADNYLTPFFSKENFLVNHYDNAEVQQLITTQATETDSAKREEEIGKIQSLVANDLSTLPLLQGTQIAVVGSGVDGATLDGSFKFRYAPLNKQ